MKFFIIISFFLSLTAFATELKEVCIHGTAGTVEKSIPNYLSSKAWGWGLEMKFFTNNRNYDNWVHYSLTLPTNNIKVKNIRFRFRRYPSYSQRKAGVWNIHLYSGGKRIEIMNVYEMNFAFLRNDQVGNTTYAWYEVNKRVRKFDPLNNVLENALGISLRVGLRNSTTVGVNRQIILSQVCVGYEEIN